MEEQVKRIVANAIDALEIADYHYRKSQEYEYLNNYQPHKKELELRKASLKYGEAVGAYNTLKELSSDNDNIVHLEHMLQTYEYVAVKMQ